MVIRTVLPYSDEAVIESRCVSLRGSLSRHICNEIQYDTLANSSNAGEKYSRTLRFENSVIRRVCHYLDAALRSLKTISVLMRLCPGFISRYAKP